MGMTEVALKELRERVEKLETIQQLDSKRMTRIDGDADALLTRIRNLEGKNGVTETLCAIRTWADNVENVFASIQRVELLETCVAALEESVRKLELPQGDNAGWLKPCPFCGEKDDVCVHSTSGQVTHWCVCLSCSSSGPVENTKAVAMVKWNEVPRGKVNAQAHTR